MEDKDLNSFIERNGYGMQDDKTFFEFYKSKITKDFDGLIVAKEYANIEILEIIQY